MLGQEPLMRLSKSLKDSSAPWTGPAVVPIKDMPLNEGRVTRIEPYEVEKKKKFPTALIAGGIGILALAYLIWGK